MDGHTLLTGLSSVLIVEDDPHHRRELSDILTIEGLEPLTVATVAAANDFGPGDRLGAAVVDLRLPDGNGLQMIDTLLTPVIIYTGHSSEDGGREALVRGAYAYVEKCSEPGVLLRHIHEALDQRLATALLDSVMIHSDARSVASEILLVEEQLRGRTARELEERLGEWITRVKIELMTRVDHSDVAGLRTRMRRVGHLLDQADLALRSSIYHLDPPRDLSLLPGLHHLGDDLGQRHGIEISVIDDDAPKPISQEVCHCMLRSVRGMIDCLAHCDTGQLDLTLTRGNDLLQIEVGSRNRDLDSAALGEAISRSGLRLFAAHERMRKVGGRLRIRGDAERGSEDLRLILLAPLQGHETS